MANVSKHQKGETLVIRTSVKNASGVLEDPDEITFKYKMGLNGDETSLTPQNISTGIYEVETVTNEAGNFYGVWTSTTGTQKTIEQVKVPVHEVF